MTGAVRVWLRAEGLLVLALGVVLYLRSGAGWGRFAMLFFVPDLSFVAYLAGPRVGAMAYNTMHSLLGPILVGAAVQLALAPAALGPLALLWAAHVGLDRALGYGLKYPSAFGDTHLGHVGWGTRPRAAGLMAMAG